MDNAFRTGDGLKKLLFLAGVLMMIYLVYALVAGILQYSMYGVAGTGAYDVINFASPNTITKGTFLTIVYAVVFLVALAMVIAGLKGGKS